MSPIFKWLLGAVACVASTAGFAAGAIASCYDGKLQAPATPPAVDLFVLIDQTTLLDNDLKQMVANQVRPFLKAGNSFSVLVFSAYTQGRYTQLLTSGQLDYQLPVGQRNDVPKLALAKLDQCLAHQPALAGQVAGSALRTAFDGTSGEIAKSDILASLKDISSKVRQSTASEKVVLVVSDMLENSSVSSFYANQGVRKIDPAQEMKLVTSNQLLSDFAGARLYVMGAGLLGDLAPKNKAQYRDPKTMQALSSFWHDYFNKSQAQLLEFGEPALLNQIK